MNLVKNWHIKFFCLTAAIAAWFLVVSYQSKIDYFPANIPIGFINVSPDLIPITKDKFIKVKIIADASKWKQLSTSSFDAKVDLKDFKQGTYSVDVVAKSLIDDVQLITIEPKSILITLEPTISKEVDVKVQTSGEPKSGYAVVSVTASPKQVKVTGPKSIVDNLDNVMARVEIKQSDTSQTALAPISILESEKQNASYIKFDPGEVKVVINYGKSAMIKPVGIDVNTIGSLPSAYQINSISVDPPFVSLSGDIELLKGISSISTKPINLDGLTKSKAFNATLDIPSKINLVNNDNLVIVNIEIKPAVLAQSVNLTKTNIKVSGNREFTINPEQLTLKISGPIDLMNNLDVSQIIIDLGSIELDSGKNQVTLKREYIKLPQKIDVSLIETTSFELIFS